MLRPSIPRFAVLIAIAILAAIFLSDSKPVWFAVGMIAGSVLRQIGTCMQSLRMVPALFQVIDWNKVDELLADESGLQ
jgi:hypothetical protein